MAENTVVKEQLTEVMIETGALLTQKLDELRLPVTVATWFFMPDINEWRLLFASPLVATEGPREMYKHIKAALDSLGPASASVPLSSIGLIDGNHFIVQMLKSALHTGPGVARIRFSKNVINGHFIDDALIYRSAA